MRETYGMAIGNDQHDLTVCPVAEVALQILQHVLEEAVNVLRDGNRMVVVL